MLKVVEAFSGIGSQNKALRNLRRTIGLEYEVINTIEWDINAIFAYDIIHNGPQDLTKYDHLDKNKLVSKLSELDLSLDGVKPMTFMQLNRLNENHLKSILCSVERTNNLISIKNVTSDDFKEDIDIFTYSFPCQDLSLSGYFHGDMGGIDREANNSSSMLWEVERILLDFDKKNKNMPKFLLMENVASIISEKHKDNFKQWTDQLEKLGYVNKLHILNANKFGVPQRRKRAFMISVYYGNDIKLKEIINERLNTGVFDNYSIDNIQLKQRLDQILKTDYTNEIYYQEALDQIPNDTPSRIRIRKENPDIIDQEGNLILDYVRTLTTKQDRNPNSGIIRIDNTLIDINEGKSKFRYLTPRESFLLMGFEEEDYQLLIDNDIMVSNSKNFLTKTKLTKMAGNSIVVNVIEEVFREINEIKNIIDRYNNN